MRIISGKNKGKVIKAPKKLPVRPTTGFAKESLFNILVNHFEIHNCTVLDLFSGTGNMSYEFGSRGAKDITVVDKDRNCIKFIRKMNFELDYDLNIIKSDVLKFLATKTKTYDLIFADPPYGYQDTHRIHEFVFTNGLLKENGWLILEHSKREDFSMLNGFLEQRVCGNVNFSIFTKEIS